MPITRYSAALIAAALLQPTAQAQIPTLHYRVGNVAFAEDTDKILVHSTPPVEIEVLPGGKTWPLLQLDEQGRIYAGNAVIDPNTGKQLAMEPVTGRVRLPNGLSVQATSAGYELAHGDTRCTVPYQKLGGPKGRSPAEALQESNINFAASRNRILALGTSFLSDGQTLRYQLHSVDPRSCKVTLAARLGNPDLLVELGHTERGGWWITGSVEQTLLMSNDGQKWRKARLPKGLSSLVSSYVEDKKQIWLAGILGDMDEHPNLLVYSPDGGKRWTSLKKNDPLLAKVPIGWLEGQKRKAGWNDPSLASSKQGAHD